MLAINERFEHKFYPNLAYKSKRFVCHIQCVIRMVSHRQKRLGRDDEMLAGDANADPNTRCLIGNSSVVSGVCNVQA